VRFSPSSPARLILNIGCWQNLSEPELADMISEFDTDNSQTIHFEGFLGKNNP